MVQKTITMKKLLFILSLFISISSFGQPGHIVNPNSSGRVANSNQVEEVPLGIMYQGSSFSALTGFTNNGATVSATGGNLQFSGGSGSFTQTLDLTSYGASMLDNWTVSGGTILGTVNGSSFGFGLGKRSSNGYGQSNALARVACNSGAGGGKVLINAGSVNGQMTISLDSMSISTGDSISLSVTRDGYMISAMARDVTTNGKPVIVSAVFASNPAVDPLMDNTGTYSIYSFGGTFSVYTFQVSSMVPKWAYLAVLGDSKTQGYAVTGQQFRFSDMLNNNFRSTINLGGGYDRTVEYSARCAEIISLHPKQIIICGASNDPRSGISSGATNTRYDSIVTALTNAGIVVYHALPFLETSGNDQSGLISHIIATYSAASIIDTYSPLKCTGSLYSDGVHPINQGDSAIYSAIVNSFKLFPGNKKFTSSAAGGIAGTSNTIPKFNSNNSITNSAITDNGTYVSSSELIEDLIGFSLNQTSGGTDAKIWNNFISATALTFAATNDAKSTNNTWMQVTRSGATPTGIALDAPVTINASSAPLTIPLGNSVFGITFTASGTSILPILANLSASTGMNMFFQNSSTASGANTILYLATGSTNTHTGSPSVNFRDNGRSIEFVVGQDMFDNGFKVNTGNFNTFSSGNLFWLKRTGEASFGGTSPLATSLLSLFSTTEGFRVPAMTTTQRNAIATPDDGIEVYDATFHLHFTNLNGTWQATTPVLGQTTLISGTKAVTITGIGTGSHCGSIVLVTPTGTTLTTAYQGVCTSNTLTLQANVAAGTINTADGSVVNYTVYP